MYKSASVKIWQYMLKEGVPSIHIKSLVEKHLTALKALPDSTERKQEEISACESFLKDLS